MGTLEKGEQSLQSFMPFVCKCQIEFIEWASALVPPTPFFGLGGEAHQSTGCAKLLVQAACYIFARDGAHMNGSGSCREGSRVLKGPNGSLGTVRKLLREAAAWRGHTAGPELGRPRWQADGKPLSPDVLVLGLMR